MQEQQSTIGSFTETVNLEQESATNSSGMNPQTSSNNMLNSADSRLSNNSVSPQVSTGIHSNAQDVQTLNGRNFGESGSRLVLSSSCGVRPGAGDMTEERQLEPSYSLFPERLHSASHVSGGSSFNNIPLSVNRNARQVGSSGNGNQSSEVARYPLYYSNNSEAVDRSSTSPCDGRASSANSRHVVAESLCICGCRLPGKRRALEGTSGQCYSAGSSSCFPPAENSFGHARPVRYDAPRYLSLFTPALNPSSVCPIAYLPQSLGPGNLFLFTPWFNSSSISPSVYLPQGLSVRGVANLQQHQSAQFTMSSAGIPLHSNLPSFQPSLRPVSYRGSLYFRAATPVAPSMNSYENRPHASHLSRNMHPSSRTATSSTRARNSSHTLVLRDRNLALQNDSNVRGIPRNNMEHHMRTPATEMRNELQSTACRSLSPANISCTDARVGPSSSVHPLRTQIWSPPHNTSRNNQQRISEPSIVSTPSGSGGSVGPDNHQLLPQLRSLVLLPAGDEETLLLEDV